MENLKAIVFDFWGVLAECKPPLNKELEKYGVDTNLVDSDFKNFIIEHDLGKVSEHEFIEKCANFFDVELSYEQCRYVFDEGHLNLELLAIIKQLKKKYKTGLLSNTSQSYSEQFIFGPGFDKLFDVLALSYKLGLRKPDPAIYQYVIDKLGLKPNEILYIDDYESRLTPARELGMQTLLYEGEKTNRILEKL